MAMTDREYAHAILVALGGMENIDEIDPCSTRLRTVVKDPVLVDRAALKATGAFGVMVHGRMVQVVVGPHADAIAAELAKLM